MENNFQATNFENQNFQTEIRPDIEMPVQNSQPKQKNKLMIPFIILLVLTVGGLTFGVFEFMQNSSLKTEIVNLKAKIEKPETPLEKPTEKPYSGELEYEYADDYAPTTTYNVKLDYETGELFVSSDECGALADEISCSGSSRSIVLTDKEMKKIWWITRGEYDKEKLTTALDTITRSDDENEEDDEGEAMKCKDSESTKCLYVDYRTTGNNLLDEILFEIYGWLNCTPSVDLEPETDCSGAEGTNCSADAKATDCLDNEGTDCESKETETTKPTLSCSAAEDIDYPYIAY